MNITDHRIATPAGQLFARRWTGDVAKHPPLILLHDSLGSVAQWREFPAQLAQACGRDVIAYDRLGFGQSDAHPARLTLDFIAAEARDGLSAVLQHFTIDRYSVLGHSVGGCMALEAAAQHGARCEAVISIAAQAFVEQRTLDGIRQAQRAFADAQQLERLRRWHGDKAVWVLSAWVDTWLDPAFANWTLAENLPRIHSPALVIHGEHDEYGSLAFPRMIAEGVSGASRRLVLQATGHMPHREQPEQVLDAVMAFLASLH